MIKYLVLLFNLIGLLVYQVFMQSTVTVTQTAPPNATPGSTFTVQVTITKGSLTGFAKYQADLPQGCTATATAKGGATVLSSGNAIKFIWSSIPGDNVISISYAVSVDPSAPGGAQNIGGKFQYVIDNQKQSSDANPLSITIGGGAATASTTPPAGGDTSHSAGNSTTASTTPPSGGNSTSTTPPSGGNSTSTTPPSGGNTSNAYFSTPPSGGNSTSTTPPSGGDNSTSGGNTTTASTTPPSGGSQSTGGNGVSAPPAPALMGVSATRSLSAGSVAPGGTIVVSVTVHKGTQSGFAKLEEIIPAGFTVTEGEKKTASFTLVDNKMKYVWLSLPADSVFTVTYNMVAGNSVSGDQQVAGTFSFVADGGPQHYPINATTFSVSGSGTITSTQGGNTSGGNTSGGNTSGGNTSGGNTSGGNTSGGNTSGGNTTTAGGNANSGGNTTIPNANGAAVIYYVQVMAFQNPARDVAFVKRYYKLTEGIDLRPEGGLRKFTTHAKFNDYKGAHDHRDQLKSGNGVSDAFVVAYNNGSRITVQNALMITQQQWYQ